MIKIKNQTLNLVMYHYIKKSVDNNYLNLKVLNVRKFEKQIIYFKRKFNILDNDGFCEILQTKKIPKKPSFLITFDDGYKDHYNNVYPILMKHKVSGIFYPSCVTLKKNELLDVNKIQLILGINKNKKKLLNRIFDIYKKLSGESFDKDKINNINLASRYDTADTVLIKRLLQFYLEKNLRNKIINNILEQDYKKNRFDIFSDFYLTKKNIYEMKKNGMAFGLHGYNHNWLDSLSKQEQKKDIESSIKYFKKNNIYSKNISFCLPYGAYNKFTLDILKNFKFNFAVTTEPKSYQNIDSNNIYTIPRYDCNDFL